MPTEKLTIVIPAFNEEETLQSSVQRLLEIEDQIAASTKSDTNFLANILIVDDGSSDQTWQKIEQLNRYSSRIEALSFSRNFGHQNALLAGLAEAVQSADMIVTIDADLQDDPTKIVDMVEMYRNGTDIVYGVRSNRSSDTWFKRFTANSYYRFRQLLGVNLIPNHADFRLMSKEAVNALLKYHEQNAFIRGLIPKLGYTSEKVYYKRAPRAVGETKYP
ncbi:glycosyltransferase family 2 protein, partial [Fructobacillus ficulneus]